MAEPDFADTVEPCPKCVNPQEESGSLPVGSPTGLTEPEFRKKKRGLAHTFIGTSRERTEYEDFIRTN